MKYLKFGMLLALALLLIPISVSAYQTNSSSYKQNIIVSEGGENSSSSTYKMNIAVGIINSIINSTSYINKLGFFHLLLLANDQPCTTASQCEGGYCCSSLCKSSACSTPAAPAEGASSSGASGAASGGGGGGGIPIEAAAKTKSFRVSPAAVKEHMAL